ncbi:LLM class flavin-dependent oxidoreductase, partial [Roseomonas alkaliterrae]|uniref:Alkanesulfonate monooxygenase SsuD/methylene tetrahydromethanopterin reductase-like flavin-dependent oxidoreductase (Luciferase family) n=1 Tax=Neoroseomonas alkaliterrae TaxID=1452450 RepID=A0A840XW53_9PROT|nr:LLM class flavin-dependent oxidoreductase [Neoroseomonas alkaliterrae]MBB5690859.1 alkanesulfonate monooxygenase SsuD/methylene tetrahydromethanopterin reductase-like flavin-dependent oxidoreductase (luciferase family) [Neoroseomonas alkaliterrae]MBR0677743.1 LLM class flavin-dependent oxidoreductase [Neoroseomonas alkaliterrae]
MLRFSNFLFPESRDPDRDAEVIADSLAEARLCDELGVEVLWLAEHHFDGNCAYVDPVTFAAAVLAATKRIKVGFAVAQVSLHHPTRLAEQLALLDNLGKGRLVVGLGRGTAYNVYEYQGYGIPHEEALERYEEAEGIMLKAWTSPEGFTHQGKHWTLKVPRLRPTPYTRPHPFVIRAASSEQGALHLARRGLPFLMNVQSNETTAKRLAAYRAAMAEAGFDAAHVARCMEESWVWRNVVVAETDEEARRIGIPAFEAMQEHRKALRERIYVEQGIIMRKEDAPPARAQAELALIAGSPETVAARMAEIEATGVGGVICSFRLGPMDAGTAARSIRLFMEAVAPRFAAPAARAAAD